MKSRFIVFSIVIAIAVLFAASGVKAVVVGPTLPLSPGVSSPPRECTINIATGKFVKIEAGPADGAGLSDVFPLTVSCGDSPCLEWTYRWTFTGITGLEALVSVDSDITVIASYPTNAQVAKIIPITAEGERFLKFPVSGSPITFSASYYTPLNITGGTLTAGYVGKMGIFPWAGKCALAGADNMIPSQNQAVADKSTYNLPTCTIAFSVASDGKAIPGTMEVISGTEDDCTVDPVEELVIGGVKPYFVGAGQFTLPGSCRYCFPTTNKSMQCTSCTTCKYVNGTCQKP